MNRFPSRFLHIVPSILLILIFSAATVNPKKEIFGFPDDAAEKQRQLEAKFDGHLNPENLRQWMRRMSSRPNHVGSPFGKENADFVESLLQSWGFETRVEIFHVLLPTPRIRELELLEPKRFQPKLVEPVLSEDTTSAVTENRLPPYNAYSADGDVTAELVYVNYGVPADYQELERRGIEVKDKIVIARYGGSWRGIKPKVAAEHGAVGCILYSDPRDDGYFQGDVYPRGPFRNSMGAQRGSVADMPVFPGDPLTPGAPATEDAQRLSVEDAPTIMKIPVLPISYGEAQPLLEALAGPVAPESWRGALPLTYHIGPGPAKVHLKLAFDWDLVPAYDVIAVLRGSEFPDHWVVRGNHRDGWVFGAADPLSGTVSLLEEARAVSELARSGWQPRRTIVYASWDAEEPGLLGSTEWVEKHAGELTEKAVAYINTDGNGRGFLSAGGSHSLERFINQIARDVEDPQTKVSVAQRLRARRLVSGAKESELEPDLRISPLGSGSDYSPFLQHLGIASLNLSFGGENRGGSYHSTYDSFDHYTRFGDPEFQYGIALAKVTGRAVLRLAQAEILPFQFENLTSHIGRYVQEVKTLADEMRKETERKNRLLEERAFQLAADPTDEYIPPKKQPAVPFLNFAPLENAVAMLESAAQAYHHQLAQNHGGIASLSPEKLAALNRMIYQTERALTSAQGLPRRPWYRHQIYAPGFYTGYGVKTLPGVREGIEERKWQEAEEMIKQTAEAIRKTADQIHRAAESLGP